MTSEQYQQQYDSTPLDGGSAAYVDYLFELYLQDPSSVPSDWRALFDALPGARGNGFDMSHQAIQAQFKALAKARVRPSVAAPESAGHWDAVVANLITAYRKNGHLKATVDPLNIMPQASVPDLELKHYGLDQLDPNAEICTGNFLTVSKAPFKAILAALEETYCHHIGIEYMHVTDAEETAWIEQQVEKTRAKPQFSIQEKTRILQKLIAAEGLEKYLGNKYVGQKRFSLEGGDSLIPALDALVTRCGERKVKEVVIGMAHRGRLNVLINILGKKPEVLFEEFEGKNVDLARSGDVKYHMGFSSDIKTPGGESVHMTLSFNPSHLEIINPVVEGSVRARQRRRNDLKHNSVLPVLIHGDAAFAGQGVVMETFCLSQARGYKTGGTVHVVINNQIGFTTSNPHDARSSFYCTDVAKMVRAPIFHVNADDPEAVVFVMQIALDYRMHFNRDVVVDMVCYRRHGHNEADEPSITQPYMYQLIKSHRTPCQIYFDALRQRSEISEQTYQTMIDNYRAQLDGKIPFAVAMNETPFDEFAVDWKPYLGHGLREEVKTALKPDWVVPLAQALTTVPHGLQLHPLVNRELDNRLKMAKGELEMNWGFAETMAYASLLKEGFNIRLSGQDSGRGTFAHRYAELYCQKSGDVFVPLANLPETKSHFMVINSVLSEEAVLGFEYGYATADPTTLVLWEAQFGDFANGAQVVIDQFISSGEQKWGRLCGLTLLLPHGYEGMGPEHSSARLERYLQLCAQHNIQVCVPSTPAQIFHLLRRQMIRKARKPLIVMTPKSLLRHKLAVSPVSDLTQGKFYSVIPEIDEVQANQVERVILCSGKVYYDILEKRRALQLSNVAICRVEQLYPFPDNEVIAEIKKYPKAKSIVWCQEEPMNQGAWYQTQHRLVRGLQAGQLLHYTGRSHSASPAVGYGALHKKEQEALVTDALTKKL